MHRSDIPSSEQDHLAFLAGGGEMGERTRAFDWSTTPAGRLAGWPQSLKIAVRIMLDSRYAMWLGWGPEFTFFYNDAYARMTLGPKHPWALGRSAREVWAEIWEDIGPRAESVVRNGQATWDERLLLFLERRGFPEETYHTFSYSPVPDDQGRVGGMLCVVTEDTERTIGERRLRTLRELAARTTEEGKSAEEACQTAARTLAENPHDLPFVLIYLLDTEVQAARLAGVTGLPEGSAAAPRLVDLSRVERTALEWPFRSVLESGHAVVVTDLANRFGPLRCGPWPEPAPQAVVVPLAKPGQTRAAGFVVAGISPRLVFNDNYQGFVDLLAGNVATAVANARAYEEERRRAEALAALDRAKTVFFSNVSHEFRTPLTLMLGPVEDLLARSYTELSPATKGQLEIVKRNGLRLLRLVNTLLDFSRIEAGRVRAVFQATDLAAFTADLASVFRAAVERAGLRLTVDCPKLAEPVYIDREMWEKIVLNLLSNAFKFTFEGEVAVFLRQAGRHAELRVRDTGTGIPAEEMPRLFERFHRIENARGRTHEGSGIGLALVQELVRLHGGSIMAESSLGRGTTFIVSVPLGSAHLPADQIGPQGRTLASTATGASPFVEEALRWLPEEAPPDKGHSEVPSYHEALPTLYRRPEPEGEDDRPRVLVADDNADMRHYVARLLAEHYRVEAVPDGQAALAAARDRSFALILTDVMMPRLDGFGLLKELRADPRTRDLPVIMLSARAGQESRVEGLEAGADDYLVKPFGARELLARVSARLQMARLRREASEMIRKEREWLQTTLASIGDGVIATDAQGCVTFLNPVAEGLTGWKQEDAGGRPLEEVFRIVNERTRQPTDNPVGRVLREGVVVGLANHTLLIARDGTERPIDDSAAPIRNEGIVAGVVLVFRDVTEGRKAQEAQAHLAAIVESSDDAIISKTLDGIIRSWNQGAERVFGYSAAEAIGRSITFLIPPDRPAEEDEILRRLRQGDRIEHFETVRVRKDGTRIDVSVTISPIRDETGQVVGASKIVRDIADRKRMEEALRAADRRKDEFLATLAHELRNPLAPLRNGLQVMRLAGNRLTEIEQSRSMMERQLNQLVRLVDDLMDVSRISRGKIELRMEPVDLMLVVRQAVETSRPLVEAGGHDLAIREPSTPIFVNADATRLAQVVANLLNNAAKYTERGGHITLAVERQESEAVVSVRDTGVGIPAPLLSKLFEMFTQLDRSLDRSQGGLGIGLWLVKRLVAMHGGSVEAKSAGHGAGSEFIIRLPALLPPAGPAKRSTGERSTRLPCRRILVADDNRDAALSLAMLLNMLGNETQTAYDGMEAVEKAASFHPDLILLDIGMPKLNGLEAARRIRQESWGKSVLLVALTGWGQEQDKQRSQEAGFDYHLVKPVDPDALEQLLADLKPEMT